MTDLITHIIFSYNLADTIQHLYRISLFNVKPNNIIVVVLWKERGTVQYQEDMLALLKKTKCIHDLTISICMNKKTKTFIEAFRLIQSLIKSSLVKSDLFSFSADFVQFNPDYFKRIIAACFMSCFKSKEGIIYPSLVEHPAKLINIDPMNRIRTANFTYDEVFTLFDTTLKMIEIPEYIKYNKFSEYLYYLLDVTVKFRMNNPVYFVYKEDRLNLKTILESLLFWWHIHIKGEFSNVYNF